MKNKIWTLLLSLVLAFGLWVYVITAISPGSEKSVYDIPVDVQGYNKVEGFDKYILEDAGLIITSDLNQRITLDLAGNRVDLNKLSNKNIMVSVDLSKISDVGDNQLLSYTIGDSLGLIDTGAVTVTKRQPGAISVNVEKFSSSEVTVQKPEVTAADGYYVDWDSSSYDDKIMIYGPARIVNKIKYAKVEPLTEQNRSLSNEYLAYELYDENDAPLTAEEKSFLTDKQTENSGMIQVNIRVTHQRTIDLRPAIHAGGGLTKDNVEITYTAESITVFGSEDELDKLEAAIKEWSINLADIKDGTKLTFKSLYLEEVGFVNKDEKITEQVVEIKYNPEVREDTLIITEYTFEAVPEGLVPQVNTINLQVKIRGSKADVERIQASDVTAVINFSGAKAETKDRAVEIRLSEEFSGAVGIMGTYHVSTTLAKEEKTAEAGA